MNPVMILLALAAMGKDPVPNPNYRPQVGDRVVLHKYDRKADRVDERVFVATTDDALAELQDALRIGDIHGIQDLFKQRKLYTEKDMTPVLVLRILTFRPASIYYAEVRILDGEHEGKKFWVFQDNVRDPNPGSQSPNKPNRRR
jgi:hypothetical protein